MAADIRCRCASVRPELGKPLAEDNELGAQTRIETVGLGRPSGFPPRERLLGAAELRERGLPAPLELGPDKPVVGIDSVELPLGVMRLVAETVDLLGLCAPQRLVGLTLRLARASPGVNLGGCHCCQEKTAATLLSIAAERKHCQTGTPWCCRR
jgi:hypothetical protein